MGMYGFFRCLFSAELWDGGKMFEEFIDEIVEWNTKELPDNTLEMQLKKIDEEYGELKLAMKRRDRKEMLEEMADFFIAMMGLYRFDRKHPLIEDGFSSLGEFFLWEEVRKAIREKLCDRRRRI